MRAAFFLFTMIPVVAASQITWQSAGAASAASGGQRVCTNDGFAALNNPALMEGDRISVGVNAHHFAQTVAYTSLCAQSDFEPLSIGAYYQHTGVADFGQWRAGASVSKSLSPSIRLAVRGVYAQLSMGGIYGSTWAVSGDVALAFEATKKLLLTTLISNPMRSRFQHSTIALQSGLALGARYAFSEQLWGAVEAEKWIDTDPEVRVSLAYQMDDKLAVRSGFAAQQRQLTLGFGYNWHGLSADVWGGWGGLLGFASGLSVSYQLNRKK